MIRADGGVVMRTEAVLIGVGVFLLFLIVVLAIRRPVQRRLFAGTGWEEWRAVAADLPWRDRWSLYVANSLGRAPTPRLASLAMQRGEVMETIGSRTAHVLPLRRSLRLVLYAAAVLCLAGLALNVAAFFVDGDDSGPLWLSGMSSLLVVVLALARGPLQRRQTELARRSVRRSRELLS